MKKYTFISLISYSILCCSLSACGPTSNDVAIKKDLTSKAKQDINFAGVQYVVDSGKVTVFGNCPTYQSREQVIKTVHSINIIKGVNNQIRIFPVVLGPGLTIKQSVDSVLANYPMAAAQVSEKVVLLRGKVKAGDLNTLLVAIEKLNPTKVENALQTY
jgi:hypothetical protein